VSHLTRSRTRRDYHQKKKAVRIPGSRNYQRQERAMPAAAAVMTAMENPVSEIDANRPAGVFISYASEDHDIAQAVYQSLQALGETVYDRVKVFLDRQSMDVGDEIRTDIRAGLRKSDFLVVLYTGVFKRSHGYTGFEVGFFAALIEEEIAKLGQTSRKIVYLCCGEPPSVGDGVLGIDINVDGGDLAGNRADYLKKCVQSPDNPDALARFFLDIANRAESRLPAALRDDRDEMERKRNRRRKAIAEDIIPALKGTLFDSMSTRVTRRSVEQKMIEFELPKPASDQMYVSMPDDAVLRPHSGTLEVFGISNQIDTMTWSEFRNELRSRDALCGASILLAVEQAVVSAVSPAIRLDNDQIIKSANDQIFRVVVIRQMDYYNGRKIVCVCFIQKLHRSPYGNNDTSMILGFINVAAKYRFIFIERESLLSVESFMFEPDPVKIQNKVRQLVRELLLIEDESRNLRLDQVAAISAYFGGDQDHIEQAKALQDKWIVARAGLMDAAEKILGVAPASADFAAASRAWLTTLKSFRNTSEELNSIVTVQALENLKKSFVQAPALGRG
jgi:TIR domain-containing protein